MAGIGFELRKILKKESLTSILEAYGYSAILAAGSWVISILAILLVGILNVVYYKNSSDVVKFQVSLTYLISLSLIVSGIHQLSFTRFVADSIYAQKEEKIIPNFFGVLLINTVISLIFILIFVYYFLNIENFVFVIIFVFTFLILSNLWILNILAISVKEYKYVTLAYLFSYILIIILGFLIGKYGISYLIFSFFIGNLLLFLVLLFFVLKSFVFNNFLSFEFLESYKKYKAFVITGLFFNLAIWADEYVFWYSNLTGEDIIGHIRASVVYDYPLFLAYLSIIPGMAIFFLRLEADFAEYYEKFYKGVVDGATLGILKLYKSNMIEVVRISIKEAIIIQGIFNIFLYLLSPYIFALLNLPQAYIPLFYVDMIATQLQLLCMVVLAYLLYLDRRKESAYLTGLMFVLNLILPIMSIYAGPYFYGYGTAIAMLVAAVFGIYKLGKVLEDLEYETFMLQK